MCGDVLLGLGALPGTDQQCCRGYSRILGRAKLRAWRVEVTAEFADWARSLRKLDQESSRQVCAAVELLKQH